MESPDGLETATPVAGSVEAPHQRSANSQIMVALMSIASAALLIRVVGMGMQIVVTARFGLGSAMDAYFMASVVPNLIASVTTSAIEASIVPVYARLRASGDDEQAARLFSTLANLIVIAAVALTAVMLVFRRQIVIAAAPAAGALRVDLAAGLTWLVFPALILSVALALLESILNAEGQFGWPAYAGLLVPLATMTTVLAAGKSLGVVTLAIGTLIGLSVQTFAFMVRMRRANIVYRPVLDMRSPGLHSVFNTAWPALAGSCIGSLSPLIDQMFASSLSAGSISALNYAGKLISVPVGVIFAAVGRAALPHLSRQMGRGDLAGFKGTLRLYLWVVAIATILGTVPMLVLAHPAVQILFQRGAFSADDANRTATTFMGFVVGLMPLALGFVLARAFSAQGNTRILMYISTFSVLANVVFDYLLAQLWQSVGIALATSAVYTCTCVILLFTLRRAIGDLDLLKPPAELLHLWRAVRVAGRAP